MRTPILLIGCLLAACSVNAGEDATPATDEVAGPISPAGTVNAYAEDEDGDEDENEVMVDLDDVPEAAKAAAHAAVPDLILEEAEREGADTYCLHGTADGVFTEVEVTGSGEILEIEQGPDDEDDD